MTLAEENALLREALEKVGCLDSQGGSLLPCTVETPFDLCVVCAALSATAGKRAEACIDCATVQRAAGPTFLCHEHRAGLCKCGGHLQRNFDAIGGYVYCGSCGDVPKRAKEKP